MTKKLRELEGDGIVHREVHPVIPAKVKILNDYKNGQFPREHYLVIADVTFSYSSLLKRAQSTFLIRIEPLYFEAHSSTYNHYF
ncbi:winged helix-turn-helix transcriptional regulator [Metabacillus niabensis]|uniref:winged helix-turn-helix transcriptional regulator n=1 Tax=Metabacillus niabensis TaxID=324854 RepID=UPI0039A1AE18